MLIETSLKQVPYGRVQEIYDEMKGIEISEVYLS
jgi:hypothetical protein